MNNKVKEICKSLNFISDNSRAIEELESTYNFYMEEARAISNKIMFLKRIISEINA